MSEHEATVRTIMKNRYITYAVRCSCGHRGINQDSRANVERQRIAHIRRERLTAFVTAWRDEHPSRVYGPSWQCPLCGKHVQTHLLDAPYQEHDVLKHQTMHGADWLAYEAAAASQVPPSAGGGEEG